MNPETEVAAYRLPHELLSLAHEQRLRLQAPSCPTDPAELDRLDRDAFYLNSIIALWGVVEFLLARGGHVRPQDGVTPSPPAIGLDDAPGDRGLRLPSVLTPAFEPLEPNFSKCRWVRHPDVLRFNEVQATVVDRLYQDWNGERKGVSVPELLRGTRRQFEPRLDQVFRVKVGGKWAWHPAWEKKLIRRLGRGEYWLAP